MSETAEIEVLDAPAQVAIFDPIEAGLNVLREEAAKTVFDLTTTAGSKAAREFRGRLVSTRTATDAAYDGWNQPILAQQRAAREKRDYILAEVKKLELPIDAQIKAQEAVKAAEKAERDRIEAERLAAAQAKIDAINAYPVRAATADSAGIQDLHDELAGIEPSLESFGNRAGEAIQARDKALSTLVGLHVAAVAREEAARVLAEQQEELRQAQAAQAERERVAAAAIAEQGRVAREARQAEDARVALQRQAEADAARARQEKEDAERAAKQKVIDDANAAASAELKRMQDKIDADRKADDDRRAAEAKAAQDKADAETAARQALIDAAAAEAAALVEAERKRVEDAANEAARVQQQAAAERHRREQAEHDARVAADTRLRNAAPAMRRALTLWIAAELSGDADEMQQAREARDEALAEAE